MILKKLVAMEKKRLEKLVEDSRNIFRSLHQKEGQKANAAAYSSTLVRSSQLWLGLRCPYSRGVGT